MNKKDIIARAKRNHAALEDGTRAPAKTSRMVKNADGSYREKSIYDASVDPDYLGIRQSLAITQEAFAKLLGITKNSYALIERGERAASESVKKLARIAASHPRILNEVA
jgi:DNA-binding XRE family transcriptional regulator